MIQVLRKSLTSHGQRALVRLGVGPEIGERIRRFLRRQRPIALRLDLHQRDVQEFASHVP
jgi:hypothetical protein